MNQTEIGGEISKCYKNDLNKNQSNELSESIKLLKSSILNKDYEGITSRWKETNTKSNIILV